MKQFDVVVAGGGVAGSAATAALSQLGYSVGIVEPGIDESRRLAGELVHDTGAVALAELGLLPQLSTGESSEVAGFSIRFGGAPESKVVRLPYGNSGSHPAFAMDHGLIRQRMLAAVSRMPGVAVLDRARITDVDLSSADRVVIRISSPAGESVLRPRLLVGADGAASPVGRLGGIRPSRRRVSTLFGFVLERKSLPDPGYGHVFLGAQGPVLAYAISSTAVRVMFDVPDSPAGPAKVNACCGSLHVLPEPFRSEVSAGLERSHVVAGATYSVVAREITRGRLVLVGDAAGCCHPLTATGLTVCARDALRLRDALRDSNRDISRALPLYSCRRRAAQRTRMVMARALYEVFCGQSPESRLMRDGLLEYWTRSQTRSARSMALLSTAEDRLRVMLMESAHVMLYSLGTRAAQTRALLGLPRLVLQAGETLWTS